MVPDEAIRLYKNNIDVDSYNMREILRQPRERIIPLLTGDLVEECDHRVVGGVDWRAWTRSSVGPATFLQGTLRACAMNFALSLAFRT